MKKIKLQVRLSPTSEPIVKEIKVPTTLREARRMLGEERLLGLVSQAHIINTQREMREMARWPESDAIYRLRELRKAYERDPKLIDNLLSPPAKKRRVKKAKKAKKSKKAKRRGK